MRWIFHDPQNRREAERRARVHAKIDRWWRVFRSSLLDLNELFRGRSEWDLPRWMAENLQVIDPGLMWEFGTDSLGARRLVITPETRAHLRPLVKVILDAAPHLAGWSFHSYRPPESVEDTLAAVQTRTGVDLTLAAAVVRPGAAHAIDVQWMVPASFPPVSSVDDRGAWRAAVIATEMLLGEQTMDKWLGAVRAVPPDARLRPVPLERLRATVDAFIRRTREQLPAQPCHRWPLDTQWSLFKFKAPPDPPGPGPHEWPGKRDIQSAVTMHPGVLQAAYGAAGPRPFDSVRFSKWGETFCYVKIDLAFGFGDSAFADRAKAEDALNAALRPAGAGCVISGGTGKRYAYIDLALADLGRGCETARQVLRDGRVPHRSWILFHDAELAAEWIGVFDNTPPPALGTDSDAG